MFSIPCVIFAGGKSSRMGEDKALLPFGNFPTLTHYQLDKLSQLFNSVYISCKSKEKFDFEAEFIEDLNKELFAPTTAFISIFSVLKTKHFFALSVDTPFITKEIIEQIIENDDENYDATIAVLNGKIQPLCGIYHSSLVPSFQEMQESNNHKLNYLLKNSNVKFVEFSNEKDFLNCNHPDEYKEAKQLWNN